MNHAEWKAEALRLAQEWVLSERLAAKGEGGIGGAPYNTLAAHLDKRPTGERFLMCRVEGAGGEWRYAHSSRRYEGYEYAYFERVQEEA